jgi:hypothetical protein
MICICKIFATKSYLNRLYLEFTPQVSPMADFEEQEVISRSMKSDNCRQLRKVILLPHFFRKLSPL